MKKGFTLMELLAVIVILGIVSVITVPIVMNMVDNSKRDSFKATAANLVKATNYTFSEKIKSGVTGDVSFYYENGVEVSNTNLKLEYQGKKPQSGQIRMLDSGEISLAIYDGEYCATKNLGATEIEIEKKSQGACVLPQTNEFVYTGNAQTFTAPKSGNYLIELWGASGNLNNAGYGGYTRGILYLQENESIYVYVGERGKSGSYGNNGTLAKGPGGASTFNGGGVGGIAGCNSAVHNPANAQYSCASYRGGDSGGGATDVRLISGTWNNISSLYSRIMISGAGGGSRTLGIVENSDKGNAGGLLAENGSYEPHMDTSPGYILQIEKRGRGATQLLGYQLGIGGKGDDSGMTTLCNGHSGGGGGYYGGTGGSHTGGNCFNMGGGGGSSFISGHRGSDAVDASGNHTGQPNHYSGKVFTSTYMIDGSGYQWTSSKQSLVLMPKPDGTYYESGKGHTGNGVAKITQMN